MRDLAGGGFIAQQRNVVLVGGTGTGKTHLAIAIARSCIRAGSRGRFFTTVDLVNQLEAESPRWTPGTHRRLSNPPRLRHPRRARLSALRPGRRPVAVPSGQPALRAHLDRRHHQSRFRRMAKRVRRSEDDHRAARSSHSSLRHRRDRQRELALQKPRLTSQNTAPHRPALAPAAQPRPAPPGRALPSQRVIKKGSILDADPGVKVRRRLTAQARNVAANLVPPPSRETKQRPGVIPALASAPDHAGDNSCCLSCALFPASRIAASRADRAHEKAVGPFFLLE